MKIIVPLAGSSEIFEDRLGVIKPLATMGAITVIEKLCSMLPNDIIFIFIATERDIYSKGLGKVIEGLPVSYKLKVLLDNTACLLETVLHAEELLEEKEDFCILHGDAIASFNFPKFIEFARLGQADGALTIFEGFNPCDLQTSDYCRVTIRDAKVTDICEKSPLLEGQVTSAGLYYFSSWGLFAAYARAKLDSMSPALCNLLASAILKSLIADGKNVVSFPVDVFQSMGKPEDVNEYNFWCKFHSLNVKASLTDERLTHELQVLIPAAGLGKRFSDAGYELPKPLIKVQELPMVLACVASLPKALSYIFVLSAEHCESFDLDKIVMAGVPNSKCKAIDKLTDGMARTCLQALDLCDAEKPLLISSCDYSFVYDDISFAKLIATENPDAIIFTFRNYPDVSIAPHAYAYLSLDNSGKVIQISEKKPISENPRLDHAVQGVFYFKSAGLFEKCAKKMIEKKNSVNGEYYVATAINELIIDGLKVLPFEVDQYVCWGTPLDLQIFQHYQNVARYKMYDN